MAISIGARKEASELLKLLKVGDSAEDLRQTIAPGRDCTPEMLEFRRQVLLAFDAMRIVRGHRAVISDELRDEILRLLKLNWSHRAVAKALCIGLLIVKRVAKPANASTWKRGRGRRFTAEQWATMVAAVKSGRRSADIERDFQCDWYTVRKIRRSLGDFENRRQLGKLSPEQITHAAEQLRNGVRWRDVAAAIGVSPTTLLRWCTFRKRPSWRYFTPAEEADVMQGIRRGEGKRAMAERLGRPRSSIGLLTKRLRARYPKLPRRAGILPKQKRAIKKARSRGLSYAAIGRRFNLSPAGAYKIVKGGAA